MGQWKDSIYTGNCVYFWPDESVQEGEMSNSKFNGRSKRVFDNGTIEDGIWENDQFKGELQNQAQIGPDVNLGYGPLG